MVHVVAFWLNVAVYAQLWFAALQTRADVATILLGVSCFSGTVLRILVAF